jgi:hypothetical protein
MYAAGANCKQVGVRVGACGVLVARELRGLGVCLRSSGPHKVPPPEECQIARLYRAGHTIAELRDLFHRTTTTIQRVMKRQGVVSRPKGQKRKYIPPLPKQGRRHA